MFDFWLVEQNFVKVCMFKITSEYVKTYSARCVRAILAPGGCTIAHSAKSPQFRHNCGRVWAGRRGMVPQPKDRT